MAELLEQSARADAEAAARKVQHGKERAQLEALIEQGLDAVEASKLLRARSAPAPAAPRPEVRPTMPIMPTTVPAAVVRAVEAKVASVIDDTVAIKAARVAFQRVSTRSQLEKTLFEQGIEIEGLSIPDTIGQARGYRRWALKPLERVSASMSKQVIVNELARLSKPATRIKL